MHAVVNRIQLREPLTAEELEAAKRDLVEVAAAVQGLSAMHVLRTEGNELIMLVFADDEMALERTRVQLGNSWMRQHVIPHAAGPPDRTIGERVITYQRPSGG